MVNHTMPGTSDQPVRAPPHSTCLIPKPSTHYHHFLTSHLPNHFPSTHKDRVPTSKIQKPNPTPLTHLLTIKNHQNLQIHLHHHPPTNTILSSVQSLDSTITYSEGTQVYTVSEPWTPQKITTLNKFQVSYDFNLKITILGGQFLLGGGICSSTTKNKVKNSKKKTAAGPQDPQPTSSKKDSKKKSVAPPPIYASTPVNREA